MRRWSLPLLLAVLLAAPGCVTVHPAAPIAPAGPRAPAADHKHPSGPLPGPTGVALPLSPLPELPEPAPAAPASPTPVQDHGPGPHRAAAADRASNGEARHAVPTPRRATAPKRAPRPAGRPKAKVKARPNLPAPPHRPARPAPGTGAGDMRQLCRAAHGVTSPAVASLCHLTYR
ncbi:hypothetical protein [Streptomyces sp. DSM 41634]|uniref:hypothetical protein n=1 Tax=Streptomyces sp. DSM 41634 TaxID=3448656 RepID=UPI004040340B